MNEIGEIILSSAEIRISDIANKLKLELNETQEILESLIKERKVQAAIENGIFKQI